MPKLAKSSFAILGVLVASGAAHAQPYDVDWYTIDAGGGYSNALTIDGLTELWGTIGQPDVSDENFSGDGHTVIGGFWHATGPIPACSDVDFNNNGIFPEDQDIIDFFDVLAGGPCPTNDCDSIDFNGNDIFPEDQDITDFLNVLAGGICGP